MGNFQNASWFEILHSQSTEKTYKFEEIFSLQGEAPKYVGFIISGTASALSYSIDGDETWVGEYTEGQFIGLMALLTDNISSFEIRAKTNLVLRILPHDKTLELMKCDTAFCKAVATDLATQLNASMSDLVNIHTLSVKGRICAELMRLASPIGIDPDRHIIRPSPVFVELARRLNSTRETVSRTVNELLDIGVISRHPGALVVENLDRLRTAIEKL